MKLIARDISQEELSDLISQELSGSLTSDGLEIMLRSVGNSSMLRLFEADGRPLCFFGLIAASLLSERAYLWMYTTEHLSHTVWLIRQSQRAIREMLERYPVIVGHGTVGADRSLAWLQFLGAKFGVPQGPVIPFEIRRQ